MTGPCQLKRSQLNEAFRWVPTSDYNNDFLTYKVQPQTECGKNRFGLRIRSLHSKFVSFVVAAYFLYQRLFVMGFLEASGSIVPSKINRIARLTETKKWRGQIVLNFFLANTCLSKNLKTGICLCATIRNVIDVSAKKTNKRTDKVFWFN